MGSNKWLAMGVVLLAVILAGMYFGGMYSMETLEKILWVAVIVIGLLILLLGGKKFWQELRR